MHNVPAVVNPPPTYRRQLPVCLALDVKLRPALVLLLLVLQLQLLLVLADILLQLLVLPVLQLVDLLLLALKLCPHLALWVQ